MANKWKFRLAYLGLVAGMFAIFGVSWKVMGQRPPAAKAEPHLDLVTMAARLQQHGKGGAGPLIYRCWPKGNPICVIRAVTNNQLVLIYVQAVGGVWTIQHVENLSSGAGAYVPAGG